MNTFCFFSIYIFKKYVKKIIIIIVCICIYLYIISFLKIIHIKLSILHIYILRKKKNNECMSYYIIMIII